MSNPVRRERYRHPEECPVCGGELLVTRVSCPSCGSELAGDFTSCEFCSLPDADMETLKVFLASRGNMREVEKHLGVSYPTARARFTELLLKLGLSGEAEPMLTREQILAEVAAGTMELERAERLLLS